MCLWAANLDPHEPVSHLVADPASGVPPLTPGCGRRAPTLPPWERKERSFCPPLNPRGQSENRSQRALG